VRSGALFAVSAAVCFGSLAIFAKLAYEEGWNVPSLLFVRFLLASLVLLPFALFARSPPRLFGAAFLIGAIGYTTITALYFPSIRLLPAAVASFLLYLAPAIVALLAAIFLHERLGRRGLAALGLALLGLGTLSSGALTGTLSPLGVALATGSAVAYALTTVLARNVAPRMPWSHLSLGISLGAATSYFLFSIATHQLSIPDSTRGLVWAAGIGILATAVSLTLFLMALARTGAAEVSVISTLEPVSTLVLAIFVLGEMPSWTGVIGGSLIVTAAAVIASQVPPPVAPE
jgi:drug/metabolite transporter (DMT)-like permease